MKILANDGIASAGKKKLEEGGCEVVTAKVPQESLAKKINKSRYDILLVRSATKVRKDIIDSCPGLLLIGRGGSGMDNIDVEHAKSKGMEVINTPKASSQSVAELVIGHLFTMARFLSDANRQMPHLGNTNFNDLKKKYGKGIELRGKTLGIIGLGKIGKEVAKYALSLGMKVMAYDHHTKRATIELDIYGASPVNVGLEISAFDEVLKYSDFITVHIPKHEKSAIIGKEELHKMKDGVYLINTARGGVIDEKALLGSLDSGKVAQAALDVFENEPSPSKELLSHPKVSLSPHIGGSTIEAQERISLELADAILQFIKTHGSKSRVAIETGS